MSLILDEHRHYLADRVRVERYAAALRETIRPGDVVVDLASGTGILGLLACRAGAARVYAIELSSIAGVARRVAEANGYGEVITVIRRPAADVELPERADVVVSDQIGRFGFEAGLLPLFTDARRRMLKPGGRTVPAEVTLQIAPVEHARQYARVEFWRNRPAGFDFTPIAAMADHTGYPTRLAARHLLADPQDGVGLDWSSGMPTSLRFDRTFRVARNGRLHGIGGWFTARLSPSVSLSNSPLDRHRTLRRQVFMPIGAAIDVAIGDRVCAEIRILPEALALSWVVTIERAAQPPLTFRHSTLQGMLIDQHEMHLTHPAYRPALTDHGVARQSVLALCDGRRTLDEIEREIFARHGALFASPADAALFVSEVVTRYTRDAG